MTIKQFKNMKEISLADIKQTLQELKENKELLKDISDRAKNIVNYFKLYPNNKFLVNLISTDFYNHYISEEFDENNVNINGKAIRSLIGKAKLLTKEEAEELSKYINSITPVVIELGDNQTLTINRAEVININDTPNNPFKITSEHNYSDEYKE